MNAHPWLEPLWRRVAVLLLCVAWLAFEALYEPGGLWFWLAAGLTAWGLWDFFLSGKYGRGTP